MSTLDWIVIGLYALGMLMIGAYYARRTKSSEDYHLGDRSMSSWMVGLSLFASLLSTISYLAVPGEILKNGPIVVTQIIAYPLIIFVVGWFLIPHFMKMRITSAYEILENKLGLPIRLLGAVIFIVLRLMWMGLVTYATCDKVLVPILGLDSSATPWLCAILAGLTLVYTSMGGLRAVVLTDVVQTIILFAGAIIALIIITVKLGGVSQWFPTQWDPAWQKPILFDFNSRMSIGGIMIATFVWYVCTCGSDQVAIQRYLATKDAKAARKAFITNMTASAVVTLFLGILGFALFAYFTKNGSLNQFSGDADKLFPSFIANELPVGLSGLVVAGLLAAAMSSLSSGINSSCSVIATDFVERFKGKASCETTRVKHDRIISVCIGMIVVGLGIFVDVVPGNLIGMTFRVSNLLVAPLFVLFFMAMFVKRANPIGAWVATVVSVTTAILIAFWEPITGNQGISFLWIMPLSFIFGTSVGVAISYLGERMKKA